jgi:hypothetical protein
MNKEVVLGLLRHALTVAGGSLAQKGYVEGSEVDGAVGAIIMLVGVALSILHKLDGKKAQP